jgi:N-methylhydantoinase A
MARQTYRIGADIGGTFTDLVLLDSTGSMATRKVCSTPDNYGRAIVDGMLELMQDRQLAPADLGELVHASTIATNAILEFKGAKTALITTRGFRDVLEIRRLRIPALYDLQYNKPLPLVPRRLRLEINERIGARGVVLEELDEGSVQRAIETLRAANVEAVAIALIHAYANDRHERRVAELVRAGLPNSVYVTYSTEILPEIREYERTSTAVVNAYVGPIVQNYLSALAKDIRSLGVTGTLQIMQSNGGIMTAASAERKPAFLTESGPAAGVIACAKLARAAGLENAISFDMGGTTCKAAMVENGEPARTTEYEVGSGINLSSKLVKGGGYPIKLPFIDVSEIGAGGGSIVSLDTAGGLHVGPRSAGAVPGPVCYGNGGVDPTFTDAMLALGYINPHALAGGRVKLDAARAIEALQERIARPMGLSVHDAAYGIYMVAAATMTRAVKAVTTYRGRDPRDFTLVAFGGNGPIAAAALAESLAMKRILVPPSPGVFSAIGLLLAEVEHEFSMSLMTDTARLSDARVIASFEELEVRAVAEIHAEGHSLDQVELRRFADLRYSGQAYELSVTVEPGDLLADLVERFHTEHARTYGHRSAGDPVELVTMRIKARVLSEHGARTYSQLSAGKGPAPAVPETSYRNAYFGSAHGWIRTPVVARSGLGKSWRSGPIVIEEYDATCVVPPRARARVDELQSIEIEIPLETAQ